MDSFFVDNLFCLSLGTHAATDNMLQVDWTPRGRGSRSEKRKAIPSLFAMCLDLLADKFDHVESLGYVRYLTLGYLP